MCTCFCCDLCISSICARSVSNITGANNIIELVKNIHDALQEKLKTVLTLLTEKSETDPQTLRTRSGNISVSPHNLSLSDSSGSYVWITKKNNIMLYVNIMLHNNQKTRNQSQRGYQWRKKKSWKIIKWG